MRKNFFFVGFIVVLLVTIPVTVYFLKFTTKSKSSAAASTVLSLITANPSVSVGSTVSVDITADPGTNAVSVVKLSISYDSTKLSTASGGLAPNAVAFPTTLDPVTYGPCTGNFCTISGTFAIGADTTKAVTTKTTVGTIKFKALATTDQSPTNITFGNQTTVYSVAQPDQASENVLSSTQPLALTIASAGTGNGSPTPAGSVTPPVPTDTGSVTPVLTNPAITPTSGGSQTPVCTSLSVDQNTATPGGTINFTANGVAPGGTVSKVTFNFGDSNVLDVTTGGGIGTNTVSVQQAHTYPTAGTYSATAVLTDNNNALSNPTSCSQTITIGTSSALATMTPTMPVILPKTGPGNALLGIGIIGIVISIVGGLLFFGL